MSEWISVDDNLPSFDEFVLWYSPDGLMEIWEMDKDMDWSWVITSRNVQCIPTHWMPLPEPPK